MSWPPAMRLRDNRRFPLRRRMSWRRPNESQNGLWRRFQQWWTRRQFYTFHKDEIITQQKQVCHAFTDPKSYENDEEAEWNNESESEPTDAGEVLNETADDLSSYASESENMEALATIHEHSPLDNSPRLGSKPKIDVTEQLPLPPPVSPSPSPSPTPPSSLKLYRNGTIDSLSGSLESLDSLVESQWDPEDDASNITPLVKNTQKSTDVFFAEHVQFLQIQTQPRKVEEVYNKLEKAVKPEDIPQVSE